MHEEKKRIIQSIINVFETGQPGGDYSSVAIHDDGAGISYGRSQATDAGGNLDAIILKYMDIGGQNANLFTPFLEKLSKNETAKIDPKNPPVWVRSLVEILKNTGKESTMKRAQDDVFNQEYWKPAAKHCLDMGLILPLSWAVVYDTCIHSGPRGVWRIRKRFPEAPPVRGGGEERWVKAYIQARREWLAAYPNPIVQKTVYRMDAFSAITNQDNWHLDTPFSVLGRTVG